MYVFCLLVSLYFFKCLSQLFFQRLEAELASHEPAIQAVQEAGEKLMDVSNLGVPEIEQRLKLLNQAWSELKQLAATRGQKLDESLTYQQFLAKVEEEEAWIRLLLLLCWNFLYIFA